MNRDRFYGKGMNFMIVWEKLKVVKWLSQLFTMRI